MAPMPKGRRYCCKIAWLSGSRVMALRKLDEAFSRTTELGLFASVCIVVERELQGLVAATTSGAGQETAYCRRWKAASASSSPTMVIALNEIDNPCDKTTWEPRRVGPEVWVVHIVALGWKTPSP